MSQEPQRRRRALRAGAAALVMVVLMSGVVPFPRTGAGHESTGSVAQRGYSFFCLAHESEPCETQIRDLRRRESLDPSVYHAAAPTVDRTLTAFATATGAAECDFVADVCRGPDSYPSADQLAKMVTSAGMTDVQVRPVTSNDAFAVGSTLVAVRRIPGGCIMISLGPTINALIVGVIDGTDECLDRA